MGVLPAPTLPCREGPAWASGVGEAADSGMEESDELGRKAGCGCTLGAGVDDEREEAGGDKRRFLLDMVADDMLSITHVGQS